MPMALNRSGTASLSEATERQGEGRTGVGDGQDDGFDELLNLLVETANRAVRVSGLGSGGGGSE